jgi:hypothetical protein
MIWLSILSAPDEDYYRSAACALNVASTVLFINTVKPVLTGQCWDKEKNDF